ncbi:MAG: hypothetical protein OXU61_09930 [Gammaproteobacteria bacterium]|nr:hypothetical protein [Gammaproteobacteria bacterium]
MRLTLVHRHGPSKYRPTTWIDWDPAAGTVSGPLADDILLCIRESKRVDNGVLPGTPWDSGVDMTHRLSKHPLKSYRDMAAIVNDFEYVIPDILKPHFPPITQEQIQFYKDIEDSGGLI